MAKKTMNIKKTLLISVGVTAVIIVVIIFTILMGGKLPSPKQQALPTPSTNDPSQTGLSLISTTPQNQSKNVPLDTPFIFTFNKPASAPQDISINPNMEYTTSLSGATLTLTPTTPLLPGKNYIVTLNIDDQIFFLTFTTTGPVPTTAPDTKDQLLLDQMQQELRAKNPAVFVTNYLPYSEPTFSANYSYVNTPTGHIQFSVKPTSSTEQAKVSFTAWLKKLGITDDQIVGLDIIYQ